MKTNRKKVEDFLGMVIKIIPKGNQGMPILKTVLFDGPGQKMVATNLDTFVEMPITITDYEKTATSTIPAEENQGEEFIETHEVVERFAVDARKALEIIQSLEPSDEIDVSISEDRAGNLFQSEMVEIGGYFKQLYCHQGDDYPEMEAIEAEEVCEKTTVSKKSLMRVSPASDKDSSGGINLNVVFFDHDVDEVVATDGHRIHRSPASVKNRSWGLSRKIATIIASYLKKDESAEFMVSETKSYITLGECQFVIRHEGDEFPDYKKFLSDHEPEHTFTVVKSDALTVLAQAGLLTSETASGVEMIFNGDGKISVNLVNADMGTYDRENAIPCKGECPEPIDVGVRVRFLADAIATAEKTDSKVNIGVCSNKSKGITVFHSDFNALIMPMRANR